jgi:glutaredoxin/glutathione-dependent peroxiredoxin
MSKGISEMTIAVGDKLPETTFKTIDADGPKDLSTADIFAGKKVVLFGVPGAFTPTCSNNHLPGYLENRDAILARGVDAIAVVATNDHHVMAAWARFTGGEGKIHFLADGNGDFVRATGLETDMGPTAMGRRSRRFSMIVDDGKVTALNVESKPGVNESGAANILAQL